MRIEVNTQTIHQNARILVEFCAAHGIQVAGVTKACCGHPDVAWAMLAGGVAMLADSRLDNIRRMRAAGIAGPFMLLRLPALSEVNDVVALTQVSLNTEVETVRALSQAARAQGVVHRVILMVDVGDRREGVMPDQAVATAREMAALPDISLIGVGTNLRCVGGVLPTRENTQMLVDVAEEIERRLGLRLEIISGGQTTSLTLLQPGHMPPRVNQLRVGEGILLGYDSATDWSLPGMRRDGVTVWGEVIELKTKPSLPAGTVLKDAFGRTPQWEDRGLRLRAILALGNQDLRTEGLRPRRPGVAVVGASSDHLIVDATDAVPPLRLGEELGFELDYAALATVMTNHNRVQVVASGECRGISHSKGF